MNSAIKLLVVSALLVVLLVTSAQYSSALEKSFYESSPSPEEIIQAEKVLLESIDKDIDIGILTHRKYRFDTEWGPTTTRTFGRFLAGQLPQGTRLHSPGGAYFSREGGAHASLGISFPYPFNFLSISVGLGTVSSVGGYYIPFPDTVNFYNVYGRKNVLIRPYVIWKTDPSTRERTVHVRHYTTTVLSDEYFVVRMNTETWPPGVYPFAEPLPPSF